MGSAGLRDEEAVVHAVIEHGGARQRTIAIAIAATVLVIGAGTAWSRRDDGIGAQATPTMPSTSTGATTSTAPSLVEASTTGVPASSQATTSSTMSLPSFTTTSTTPDPLVEAAQRDVVVDVRVSPTVTVGERSDLEVTITNTGTTSTYQLGGRCGAPLAAHVATEVSPSGEPLPLPGISGPDFRVDQETLSSYLAWFDNATLSGDVVFEDSDPQCSTPTEIALPPGFSITRQGSFDLRHAGARWPGGPPC